MKKNHVLQNLHLLFMGGGQIKFQQIHITVLFVFDLYAGSII